MKLRKLVGDRFKERPADCAIDSHALMVRGGYMKYVANGIYSSYLPLRRIARKIEQIIREEMDAIDGQEVQFPVALPASLWEESGRYESVGKELLRFSDRNGSPMVLGMTHEEAAVQLVREYGQTYSKYPFMIYQIQTKFRDEARPRAGLIRVREFTMKDAYSFHTSQEDLESYYMRCHAAYERIFARAGIPEVISVASDSGMMGGNLSHEFMLLTPVGEDSIALCDSCGYRANMEAAECITVPDASVAASRGNAPSTDSDNASRNRYPTPTDRSELPLSSLTEVHTPDCHTIEEVCSFLHSTPEKSCKAVVYQRNEDDRYVVLFLRGDLEVNETKLTNFLGCEIHPALITEDCGLTAGFIGPLGLTGRVPAGTAILFDRSLAHAADLVCGANRPDYHYTGLSVDRDLAAEYDAADFCASSDTTDGYHASGKASSTDGSSNVPGKAPGISFHDFAKIKEGGICPNCGKKTIRISRGIEVGNIFQLGTKYTKSMHMEYTDCDGTVHNPVMGCYGIGVGRLAASVCEAHHDEYGPIWPLSIAPWQVHLCAVRADREEVKEFADTLYEQLQAARIEVIYDDRSVSAGILFSDADLLGVPYRIIVSPRNLKEHCCEIVTRDKSMQKKVPLEEVFKEITSLLNGAQ